MRTLVVALVPREVERCPWCGEFGGHHPRCYTLRLLAASAPPVIEVREPSSLDQYAAALREESTIGHEWDRAMSDLA